ncbi:unnamed protein product [Rotaria socialis]
MIDKFSCLKKPADKFICGPCMWAWVWAPLIPLIIWGLVSANSYREKQYERSHYTNTSCQLLKYSYSIGSCENCGEYQCYKYKCYNEQFDVLYYVWWGKHIYATITTNDSREQHPNQQIGSTYQCFHKSVGVTSVKWDLPTGKSFLIQFWVAVTLFIINILLIPMICRLQYMEYQ